MNDLLHRHNAGCSTALCAGLLLTAVSLSAPLVLAAPTAEHAAPSSPSSEGLQVEVVKKGLGKEVTIRKGSKEWYMLVEVTESNSVVIRQEKDRDTYLVDESETHDHALSKSEVDSAIEDFINSVKTQVKHKP
nr:hypothetical protein [Nitrospirota bacterium]